MLVIWATGCAVVALVCLAVGSLRVVEPRREPVPDVPRQPDWRAGLRKSRLAFSGRLHALLRGAAELSPDMLDRVEEILFAADIGTRTVEGLLDAARAADSPSDVRSRLEKRALEILQAVPTNGRGPRGSPHVLLVVGVNGSGKTTTVGKLAARWVGDGQRVLVAAADTFRAAAIEQLEIWAERAGAEFVRGSPGGDPAAVAFDAVRAARARGLDTVIVDTAGRLQTRSDLMDELSKIERVVRKDLPGAPHEVLLVLDANVGQNAIRQAQEFSRAVSVDGIVLTKLDGTAKGGVVLGVAEEVGIPVRYVGLGERIEDLAEFDSEAFVRALFELAEGEEEESEA